MGPPAPLDARETSASSEPHPVGRVHRNLSEGRARISPVYLGLADSMTCPTRRAPNFKRYIGISGWTSMEELTFFEAALRVLQEAGGQPLHYREIASRALTQALIKSSGKTPEATIGAILYSHVKQAQAAGEEPKVVAVGKGFFSLPRGKPTKVEAIVAENNKEVQKRLLQYLHEMDPTAFENLIAALLSAIGFENVEVIGRTGDGGLDVHAELTVGGVTRVETAVQVKRWRTNVPGKIVRELRGALQTHQRGLIMTTSDFTREAMTEAGAAGKSPISLIDGQRLVSLLIGAQIGVKTQELKYLTLDVGQLEELEENNGHAATRLALSLWPIPGGIRNYVQSAVAMLGFIAKESPTLDQMVHWMKIRFERAKSDKTIRAYIGVLKTLGLLDFEGEKVVVTPEGAECLSGDPRLIIARQLQVNIAGITEVLQALRGGPMTKESIHQLLLEELKASWKTMTQTDFRLLWLENVGLIKKKGQAYSLGNERKPG